MADYKLYGFAQSGNVYKVALMLQACGADWTCVKVDMLAGENKTPDYLAINETGEVPALKHGDVVLGQSGVILDYLSEQFDLYGWADNAERREVLRWILFDNHKFSSLIGPLRFMKTFMGRSDAAVDTYQQRAEAAFGVVDRHLDGRQWVALDRASIADFSLAGYMFYRDEVPVDFDAYPNLQAWRARVQSLPGWTPPYELLPRIDLSPAKP
ncbi:MAG: glutathione S-transferase family protein [Maricaulaceae bacterium]